MNLELDRGDRNPPGEKASAAASRSANDGTLALPDDALIILPVRKMVLFPGMILPIALGREASIAAAQAAAKAKRPVGVLLQRNAETDKPGPDELRIVGTIANIVRYVTTPDGTHHVICQGQQRFRVVEYLEGYPFMAARVGRIEEPEAAGNEIEARFEQLKERALQVLELLPQAPQELKRWERMSDASVESSMVRTYLDWLIELPWKSPEPDAIDMAEARRILDADHFGLDQVKKRIVEFLAVRKLNPEGHGPILCFVGPPGVGKTSLGQSVAKALWRN